MQGETDNLKLKADSLSGWDLSYLKFCCKVQGIRNELFASDTVAVISLDDIKSYFPQGTVFEDYWPNKVVDSQLLLGGTKPSQNSAVHWTRQPAHPPPKQMMTAQQITKTQANNQAQVRKIAGNPNLSQQQMYTNEVQQQYLRSMQSAANGLPQQGLSAAVQVRFF